jgi:hypothetical protein
MAAKMRVWMLLAIVLLQIMLAEGAPCLLPWLLAVGSEQDAAATAAAAAAAVITGM